MAASAEVKTVFKLQNNNLPNSENYEEKANSKIPPLNEGGGEGGNELQTVQKSILRNKEDVKEHLPDPESAYAESFCSDESYQEDSELTNVTPDSSLTNFTLRRSESSQSNLKRLAGVQLSRQKRINSASQTFHGKSLSIEDGMKLLNLNSNQLDEKQHFKRRNMSFTNNEIQKIERDNELLLRRIMMQQRPTHSKHKTQTTRSRVSSSAINRKKFQRKIEEDNMILLRRLQQAKPCIKLNSKTSACRMTNF